MSEIVIEEMKDKKYEDNILVKVLLYYMKNIDEDILHLDYWGSFALDVLTTKWLSGLNIMEKSMS